MSWQAGRQRPHKNGSEAGFICDEVVLIVDLELGHINMSETTYAKVKDELLCTYRGQPDAKGKGKLKMYYLS